MIKALALSSILFVATLSASVVQPIGGHYQVLVPVAGSTAGGNNTFFRSDITIVNLAQHAQTVRLEWLSQNGTSNTTRFIEMNASSGLRSSDFVSEVVGTSGLGSLVMTAMTSQFGTIDTTGVLFVNSRVWTPQPGTAGTTSQSFPAIPVNTINTFSAALFSVGGGPAPDEPANYRANVGIVNLDPVNTQTFTISGSAGVPVTVVTLPPRSMVQVPLGNGLNPNTQVVVQNATGAGTRSNSWIAYQSTVNNISGDGWTELGVAGQ